MLSDTEKRFLLLAARQAIENAVHGGGHATEETPSGNLFQPSGAFVTLWEGEELRGCIGYIDAMKPLIECVRESAVRAAMDDPRFPPLGAAELPNTKIEISVLSRLQRINHVDEIEIGRHGLVVESNRQRGVLLPRVAVTHHWDTTTFLEQTLLKAGLPHDLWKSNRVAISTFTAEVFSEWPLTATSETT